MEMKTSMTPFTKYLARRCRLPLATLCGVLATTAATVLSADTSGRLQTQGQFQTEPPAERRIDASVQKALAVTIYNDDLALVKDLRSGR